MVTNQEHVLVVDADEQFAIDTAGVILGFGLSATSAGSIEQAIESANRYPPTLAVAEIDVDGELEGLGLAETIRSRWGAPVILTSTRADRETLAAIAEVDASGVLCKPFHWRQLEMTLRIALERRSRVSDSKMDSAISFETPRAELETALRRIAAEISRIGFGGPLADYSPSHESLATMRPREREVVTLLLQHQRVPAIARTLSISPATVRNHLKSVFRQLGVHSQQELLIRLRQGKQ